MSDKPIAMITGGAQGIGYACAKALADDGHKVVLVDAKPTVTEAAETLGGAGYVCDLSKPEAVLALFDQIEAEHGVVAKLVNNAGIALPGNFLDYDLADFDAVLAINLRAVFVAIQRAN